MNTISSSPRSTSYDPAHDGANTTSTPLERNTLEVCRKADTLLEAFICGEPTAMSDACRTPKDAVTKALCDDPS